MKSRSYPNLAQSWGIVGVAILANLILIPLNNWLNKVSGKETAMLIYYSLAMGAPLMFAYFLRKKESGRTTFSWKRPKLLPTFFILLCLLGLQIGFTMPIASLIPMPESIRQMFLELSKMNGIAGFLTIAVAAPFLEEMIFRGVILDGLLKKYSVGKAIFWSSFLFGIVHLNPWQFISAMTIGCLAAWIYSRTYNLTLCVIMHFANNSLAFISMYFFDSEKMMSASLTDLYGTYTNACIIISCSLLVAIACFFYLNKSLPKVLTLTEDLNQNDNIRKINEREENHLV